MGALLVTDRKENLGELFVPEREVAVYSTAEEAAEVIHYYLEHPREAEEIALRGQARTLREHTYRQRIEALVPMLEACLQRPARS